MKQVVISLAEKVGKIALQAYRRDRDHYVRLLEPYTVGRFLIDVPDYDCELFTISDGTLTLKAAGERHCDGATFAPDKIGDKDFAGAYIAHDYWYEMIDSMAKESAFREAGLDAGKLKDIGDAILAAKMQQKSGLWARVYYWGVRTFGGLFRRLGLASLSLLLAVVTLSGCAGCLTMPDGIFEPSGDEPSYEIVPREAQGVNRRHDAAFAALGVRVAACPHSCARTIAADCGPF